MIETDKKAKLTKCKSGGVFSHTFHKKGFTLIELLAVIVILAIIALITTPIIMNVINDSKKGAATDAMYGYVKAVELATTKTITTTTDAISGNYTTKDGNLYDGDTKILDIAFKGTKPKDGGTIKLTSGQVIMANLIFDEIKTKYQKDGKVESSIPVVTKNFAEDNWDTIVRAVKNGDTENYHVGDIKEINMGSLGMHTVRIANMSSPDECEHEEFSETACGFVIEFTGAITQHQMNLIDTNVGGWEASEMRNYVNSIIYNALPEELKLMVLNTKVISKHGSTVGETNFITTDKLYLLSSTELWGQDGIVINSDTSETETRQLDYYKQMGVNINNRSGAIKKLGKNAIFWRLRTALNSNASDFRHVDLEGNHYFSSATSAIGVSPAFRIG